MTPKALLNQIRALPKQPGVYLFRDAQGKLLYVGKAKSLKDRISSYFHNSSSSQPSPDLTPAKQFMVAQIDALETTIVSNETEALLYEAELIKRHRPSFNVVLADDKSFVYVKFDFDRVWPDVYPIRRPCRQRKSRSLFFGPYPSARAAYTVLRLAKRVFPYCQKPPRHLRPPHPRGCLNWHLGRCPGPCMGAITPAQYAENLTHMIPLFQGRMQGTLRMLQQEMRAASRAHAFEQAAIIRDQVEALQVVATRQNIVGPGQESYDVAGLVRNDRGAVANIFRVREGALVDHVAFPLRQTAQARDDELLQSFTELYYATTADVPRLLIVPFPITSPLPTLRVEVPRRGKKYQLMRMGEVNAQQELVRYFALQSRKTSDTHHALTSLQELLSLPKLPERIEAYDISNIQGLFAYGAMTVALNGITIPSEYRSFRIRTVTGSNDVACFKEMLKRRFAHSIDKLKSDHWPLPDLIVLDGGKPQLAAAREILNEYRLNIPIITIAKGRGLETRRRRERGEEVWSVKVPDSCHPEPVEGLTRIESRRLRQAQPDKPIKLLKLQPNSPALRLFDRIRDEAHRFGLRHYRARHRKELVHLT